VGDSGTGEAATVPLYRDYRDSLLRSE